MALGAFGIGVILLPLGSTVRHSSQFSKMQRMDIGGAVILTSSLCLFILGLTSKLPVSTTYHLLRPTILPSCRFRWHDRWVDQRQVPSPIPYRCVPICGFLGLGKLPAR